MNLQALSREIHEEQDEKRFHTTPLPTDMPIRIDMTIGDSAARIVKVKHQGVEETVRVMNKVLRKMNSNMKIGIVKDGSPMIIPEPDLEDTDIDEAYISKLVGEEPIAVERA